MFHIILFIILVSGPYISFSEMDKKPDQLTSVREGQSEDIRKALGINIEIFSFIYVINTNF